MGITGRDADDEFPRQGTEGVHQHRGVAWSRGAITELSGAVCTPGGDEAIGGQCQRMDVTSGDGHHTLACQHTGLIHWRRKLTIIRRAIPQHSTLVETPAQQGAVRQQSHGVPEARGHTEDGLALHWAARLPHGTRCG